jgi:hypothetical protein
LIHNNEFFKRKGGKKERRKKEGRGRTEEVRGRLRMAVRWEKRELRIVSSNIDLRNIFCKKLL